MDAEKPKASPPIGETIIGTKPPSNPKETGGLEAPSATGQIAGLRPQNENVITPPNLVEPNAQVQPVPPPNENPFLESEKSGGSSIKKKILLLVTIIIFLLVFLGGGSLALAYSDYKFFSPPKPIKNLIDSIILSVPLPKTPRLILGRAQTKITDLKTALVETEIKFSTPSLDFPVKSAKLVIKGPAEFKTENQTRSQFDISGEVALEGIQVSAAGSVRQIDKTLYFKLTEVPGGSFLPLNDIKDQWFSIDTSEFEDTKEKELNKEIANKLKVILEKFVAKSVDWATFDDGSDDTLYSLSINPPKEEIDNLVFEIIEAVEPKTQSGLERSIEKGNLSEITKSIQSTEFKLKVRKKDYLVNEGVVLFSMNVPAPAGLSGNRGLSLAPTTSVPIKLSLSTKLSEFNEPIIVEIPQNAKDFKSYLGSLEGLLPKELDLPLDKQFTPPTSTGSALLQPQTPEESGGFRGLLEETSPVLGIRDFWDLRLLEALTSLGLK